MIRMLGRSDTPLYRHLRLQALQTDPQAFLATFESEHPKSLPFFEYELTSVLVSPCYGYYGLFTDDGASEKLIGFCQAGNSYLAKQRHVAFLYNVYIDPEYRNQGRGRELISHILHQLKNNGIEVVIVSHLASNVAAHRLYLNLGFVQTGVRPNTVKWHDVYDDEVEMVLQFV